MSAVCAIASARELRNRAPNFGARRRNEPNQISARVLCRGREQAGVEYIDENGPGPGLRLRRRALIVWLGWLCNEAYETDMVGAP